MSRRRLISTATVLGLVVALAACSNSSEAPQQPTLEEPPIVTTFDRLAAKATATGDANTSLQLFALQFGALPGVPVPPDGKGPPTEANLAMSAVFNVWDEITSAQRSSILTALELPPDYDPNAPIGKVGSAGAAAAGAVAGDALLAHPAIAHTRVNLAPYEAAGRQAENALSAKLGPLGVPVVYRASSLAPVTNGTPALASALVAPGRCQITVYPTFRAPTGPSVTLAHELTHCYQQVWRGATYLPRSRWWIQEGSAEWAGSVIATELGGSGDSSTFENLSYWIHTPGTTLEHRNYDAYGLFAYANMRDGAVWSRLRATTTAPNTPAAIAALNGDGDSARFVSEWATTQVHRSNLGPEWTITGPGVPTNPRSQELRYEGLANGGVATMNTPAWANSRWVRNVTAETVRFTVGAGTVGAVHLPGGTRNLAELTGHAWCTAQSGNCTCPIGTARKGEQIPRLDASQLVAAAGGGNARTSARLAGRSLRDECGEIDTCPVGTWELETLPPIPRVAVQTGGTGTRLIISENGQIVQDFSNYVPLVAKSAGREPITVYLAPTGTVTAKIAIPSSDNFVVAPVTDVDASGLGGTAYTEIGGQRVNIPMSDLRDMGLALGSSRASTGPAKLKCSGANEVVLEAAPGVTQTYRRIG